jgi:hypothetical protein
MPSPRKKTKIKKPPRVRLNKQQVQKQSVAPATAPTEKQLAPTQLCKNCGHQLHGEYCSHCGQEHTESAVPGHEMLREFLKDEFHFDYRIIRTIFPLLFRPGFLSAEYVAGRRVRYVPPLRTYVFISIIMFGLIAIQARKSPLMTSDKIIAGTEEHKPKEPINLNFTFSNDSTKIAIEDTTLTGEELRDSVLSELKSAAGDSSGREESSFEKKVKHGLVKLMEDKEKFLEQLLERSAQAMFLLMPIFALLLKLLYLRRKRRYMEHLVFALHSHAHTFLMFAMVAAGSLAGWAWLQSWLKWPLIAIPIYLFLGMKKYYGQGWGKTLAKYLLLLSCYGVALLAAGLAVVVVSVVWL